MSTSLIKQPVFGLKKVTVGYWTPSAGNEISLSLSHPLSVCELLIFTPFSSNRYQSSLVNDVSHFTTSIKSRLSWDTVESGAQVYHYLDLRRKDDNSIYCEASSNIPADTRLEMFALIPENLV